MNTTLAERQQTGLKALVSRHPIAAFLLLALGSVYLMSMVPILMTFDVIPGKTVPARLGIELERATAGVLTFFLFGAALLVTYLDGGRRAVRELLQRIPVSYTHLTLPTTPYV